MFSILAGALALESRPPQMLWLDRRQIVDEPFQQQVNCHGIGIPWQIRIGVLSNKPGQFTFANAHSERYKVRRAHQLIDSVAKFLLPRTVSLEPKYRFVAAHLRLVEGDRMLSEKRVLEGISCLLILPVSGFRHCNCSESEYRLAAWAGLP